MIKKLEFTLMAVLILPNIKGERKKFFKKTVNLLLVP